VLLYSDKSVASGATIDGIAKAASNFTHLVKVITNITLKFLPT